MKSDANLIVAWSWILLSFLTGMILGMFFHGENWLGGYSSFKRRMYRLAHISLFALGTVNLLFWLTVRNIPATNSIPAFASWLFIIGAVTMPLCCILMAHFPRMHFVFAIPVISLVAGGALTLILVISKPESAGRPTAGPAYVLWHPPSRL